MPSKKKIKKVLRKLQEKLGDKPKLKEVLKPFKKKIKTLKNESSLSLQANFSLKKETEQKLNKLNETVNELKRFNQSLDLETIRKEVRDLSLKETPDFATQITESENKLKTIISVVSKGNENSFTETKENIDNLEKNLEALKKSMEDVFSEIGKRLDQSERLGGGAMNRQILVNDVNYLTKYTDINLVGGITATSDDLGKRVDIDFSGLSGANTALSNLASVAINTDLIGAVSGGLGIRGGTAANDDLILEGTTNATRDTSYVILQPNGGNVGIRNSTPIVALHVGVDGTGQGEIIQNGGSFKFRSNMTHEIVVEDSLSSANLIITGGGNEASSISFKATYGVGTTSHIKFLVGNNGGTEAMRILNNGDVGIGTATPTSRLAIVGLPTSASGLSTGDVWSNSGVLTIV